jgi:imidazolonepropionase-like amidohydrolase
VYNTNHRLLLIAASLVCGLASSIPGFGSDLVLVHARIYTSPAEKPIDDGTVVIHNGQIRAAGPGKTTKAPRLARLVTVLDCTGMSVTAGLWNSHVHILTVGLLHADQVPSSQLTSQLEAMLTRWGFTTVFDTASLLANTNVIRKRIADGEVMGPKILTVGEPFYPKDGVPVYVRPFLEENHIDLPTDQSNTEAVARVGRQVRDGADGIKIFAGSIESGGVLIMPLDMAKAIVAEAHRLGKPVFAHPSNEQGVEVALQSGIDVLAHVAPMSGPWTPALVERMKAAHIGLIPTLTLFDVEAKKAHVSPEENQEWINAAVDQLKAYSAAGGQILFGTDVGYTDHYDTAEEYILMSQAGMSFPQILASLTTNPAERFGRSSHSGRIAKQMDADLAVLDGDPSTDIAAFSKVRYTIRNGKIIYKRSR